MPIIKTLFANNQAWAAEKIKENQHFFTDLALEQTPQYLWIGCADSRVPASHIVGLTAGDLFVHRNVANLVIHTDLNCLSVIQYAVEVLKVKYIVVCGHYGCGGVAAAISGQKYGLIDNWLCHIRDIWYMHRDRLHHLPETERVNRLCELNVIHQVLNVCQSTVVQDAWSRNQPLAVHGWVYGLNDGILRDLGMGVHNNEEISRKFRVAVDQTFVER